MTEVRERYNNLHGLRAYACLGIVVMHVLANAKFGLTGFVFENLIPSFTNLTYLFMLLSAFSMCCGYYEKITNNKISTETFYLRRYERIWPFFAVLCTLELIVNHDMKSLYEWIADLTLAFGFIPEHHIEVVGVGWFLGTLFVFYMVFPFFVFLLKNKKRGWFVLILVVIIHILFTVRFVGKGGKQNFLFSSPFFVAGGLIYLYRNEIKSIRTLAIFSSFFLVLFYFLVDKSDYTMLVLFSSVTITLISNNGRISKIVFQNKAIQFLGSISLEIYLCHMFLYRILERLNIQHISDNNFINYLILCILTILGAILISAICKELMQSLKKHMNLEKRNVKS